MCFCVFRPCALADVHSFGFSRARGHRDGARSVLRSSLQSPLVFVGHSSSKSSHVVLVFWKLVGRTSTIYPSGSLTLKILRCVCSSPILSERKKDFTLCIPAIVQRELVGVIALSMHDLACLRRLTYFHGTVKCCFIRYVQAGSMRQVKSPRVLQKYLPCSSSKTVSSFFNWAWRRGGFEEDRRV